MKIIRILRSKLYGKFTKQNEPFVIYRRSICETCPLNSKNKKDTSLWYKFMTFVNLKEPFCTVCGCEIAAKTSEELEECPEKKWLKIL